MELKALQLHQFHPAKIFSLFKVKMKNEVKKNELFRCATVTHLFTQTGFNTPATPGSLYMRRERALDVD